MLIFSDSYLRAPILFALKLETQSYACLNPKCLAKSRQKHQIIYTESVDIHKPCPTWLSTLLLPLLKSHNMAQPGSLWGLLRPTYLVEFCCCCLCLTPCHPMDCSTPGFLISWSSLKIMSIEPVILSNHLIFCCPLLLPSIFPSIRGFSNESALRIRWPKYWSFRFRISPSNIQDWFPLGLTGLISFLSKLTLKSLLQAPQFKSISSLVLSLLYGPTEF